jgi:ABC-2 type transport system ATP-binding protein
MTAEKLACGSNILEVNNLHKSFGRRTAIAGLSLCIPEGQTYGLIGPNGAGKTTFIRIAMGLSRADSGEVIVLGHKLPDRSVAGQIGYMTQKSALYNDLTVKENLKFFAALYGLSGIDGKRRIDELLELVELTERRDEIVGNLSGGMIQRASLASALLHKPKLLFLDEPTAGVDPELRLSFWNYFEQLNKEGVTLIVSTHNLDEASRCHTLGMLRTGKLIAEGAPAELLARTGAGTLEQAFLRIAKGSGESV